MYFSSEGFRESVSKYWEMESRLNDALSAVENQPSKLIPRLIEDIERRCVVLENDKSLLSTGCVLAYRQVQDMLRKGLKE